MKLDHNLNVNICFGNLAELMQLAHELRSLILRGDIIMSGLDDFTSKQTASIDKIQKAVEGLTKDIRKQTSLIEKLQSSAGQMSPDQQKVLSALQERTSQLADKVTALNDLNPDEEEGTEGGETVPGNANAGGSNQPSTQPAGGSINEAAGNPNASSKKSGSDSKSKESLDKNAKNLDEDEGQV